MSGPAPQSTKTSNLEQLASFYFEGLRDRLRTRMSHDRRRFGASQLSNKSLVNWATCMTLAYGALAEAERDRLPLAVRVAFEELAGRLSNDPSGPLDRDELAHWLRFNALDRIDYPRIFFGDQVTATEWAETTHG
jgi:hypothetical protein